MTNDNQLVEVIFSLSRIMRQRVPVSGKIAHLSMLQLQALNFLKRKREVSMSGLACQFNIELPSATSLVNNLCKMNLVKRAGDKNDRRRVSISLTAQGESLLTVAMREKSKNIKASLSYLSDQDKKDLLRITQKLLKKIEKANHPN